MDYKENNRGDYFFIYVKFDEGKGDEDGVGWVEG